MRLPRPWLRELARALVIGAALLVIGWLAVYRLRAFPYPLDVVAAWTGARTVAEATLRAAAITWAIVGVALYALAGWLRRRAPDLTRGEAIAGAACVLWCAAYLALLSLGPVGLFQPLVLRAGLAAIVLATLRFRRQPPVPARSGRGAELAVLAITISLVPLALMQIGSPVSPFMDVLGYIAPVQKIVTFRWYEPFANDAAGLWAPTRQVVGYDAAFSALALLADLRGHLAISSMIVPFAALQVLAVFLLGRAVQGPLAGGMASLFMLQTFLWRRTPDIRSSGLAFALVAIGIAFLLTCRRGGGMRAALGGLALGMAVTVSPLIGGTGMQVASLAIVIGWLDLRRPFLTPVLALAAGSLLALPQVVVGVDLHLPWVVMPVSAIAGALGLAALAARPSLPERGWRRPHALARVLVIGALPVAVLLLHARRQSEFFNDLWFGYPILALLGGFGLVAAAVEVWRSPELGPGAAVPALALWIGILDHAIADPRRFYGPLEMRSLASEVTPKMISYWAPYWLAVAAGVWFGLLARRWSYVGAVALALLVVVYPLRAIEQPLDYDGQQLSVAETWGFHLATAAHGYHAGRGDRRWVLSDAMRGLTDTLESEIAAGRIDYHTHVLDIAPSIDTVEVALWTGVSIDLITPQYTPGSIWTGNGRARAMNELAPALARRPPYAIVQDYPNGTYAPLLGGYVPLYSAPGVTLYRLADPRPLGSEPRPLAGTEPAPPAATDPSPALPSPVSDATT